MAYSTASNQVAVLKELYPDGSLPEDLVYKMNPLLALIPKDESPDGMGGKYMPVPVVFGTPQGRSAAFSTAQTNQTQVYDISFFVYRASNYQVVTITNELIEASKGNAAAFVDAVKLNMDTGTRNITNDLAADIYGDGTGKRGAIASISSGVITLVDAATVVQFEVGMALVSYSVSGTTYTQSTSAAIGYVIAVNRSSGVVTVSATAGGAAGTPTSWSTTFPNLAVSGDIAFGAITLTTQKLKITGLQGWIPATAPSSGDSFWGVDRSQDVTRLSGIRYDGSAESIEEALIDGAAAVNREGGSPDMCFINFASYAALLKALGAKVQYVQVKHDTADISFSGLQLMSAYGPLTVVPDRNCPALSAYLLQMDTWKLRSLGKCPQILKYGIEGLEGLRVGNADALEVRLGYYGNVTCKAPGWNCVVTLSQ